MINDQDIALDISKGMIQGVYYWDTQILEIKYTKNKKNNTIINFFN